MVTDESAGVDRRAEPASPDDVELYQVATGGLASHFPPLRISR